MKLFAMMVMSLMSWFANAQSISLLAGKSFSPADFLSLRYTHYSNSPLKISLGGFYEKGTKYRLAYGSFGADVLLHCDHLSDVYPDRRGGLSGAIGLNWQVDQESWLYKDWPFSKRSSFGLTGEVAYQYYLTDAFRIGIFSQHKLLFNPAIGMSRWVAGLSLSHPLSY